MKIAKQILQLTSIAFIAIGLSFILISGIVIGSQMSIGAETQLVNLQNKEAVRMIEARHDYMVAQAEQTRYQVEYEWVLKTGSTWDKEWKAKDPAPSADAKAEADKTLADAKATAERAKTNALAVQKELYKSNQRLLKIGTPVAGTTLSVAINTSYTGLTALPNTGAVTIHNDSQKYMQVPAIATLGTIIVKKPGDRFIAAFQAHDIVTGADTIATPKLSPMGMVMVSGLALTLVGAAMIVGIIFINKSEGKKGSSKKAA